MSVSRRAYLFFGSGAVIFTLLVIAVVYRTRGTIGLKIYSRVSMIWLCPSCTSNVSTEFRETFGSISEDVSISNPSPKEEMLLAFRNHFQVLYRQVDWLHLEAGLWSKHKRHPFILSQGIEINPLLRTDWPKGHIPFQNSSACWSGTAVRHSIENIEPFHFSALDVSYEYWTAKTDKSPLRRYGSIVSLIADPPEQATEYHEDACKDAAPHSGIENLFEYALILATFASGGLAYILGIICIWHSLESGKFRFFLLAGLFFIIGWYATGYIFYLTRSADQFLNAPNVVRDSGLHRGCNAKRLVHAAEIEKGHV
jgi:hypothetical protein